ncbi:MAG TPA: glutamate 5-kinase [Polyangia bacterium]|jgi:glutamate 5-kinase
MTAPRETRAPRPRGHYRRVVVKLGSAVLADPATGLREGTIRALAREVSRAAEETGVETVVVTSGAIAAGRRRLGLTARPRTMALKQAAAAVGQTTLMRAYERAFEAHELRVGQLLLTHEDFASRERYNNARGTLLTLLGRGIVPVINENDTVATQEIRLGDNDHLAALVAQMLGADLLVLFTDQEGLYDRDPRRFPDARLVRVVETIDDGLLRAAAGQRDAGVGTGGMASKLRAAGLVATAGIPVVIASGLRPRALTDVLAGAPVGTMVRPRAGRRTRSRKLWIAFAREPRGVITVDDGARRVLVEQNRSLLPAGVVGAEGRFAQGDAVAIADRAGRVFARGLAAWSHDQVARAMGRRSAELRELLGAGVPAEVVHRDDLVILEGAGAGTAAAGRVGA